MCNQNKNPTQPTETTRKNNNTTTIEEYRFLDYRLNQLETKLERGLDNIEQDQRRYNIEVMKTLQTLQEGQNRTTENMAKVRQHIDDMEEKLKCIDKLKDVASKNTARITAVNHRVDVVQKILFAVATAAISALFTALISIAQMFLLH
jgi:CHASE3 domain sensor protein